MEYTAKKSVSLIRADVEDACIEHGIRGFLRHNDIEKMVANYSEEEREARVHGRFQHLTGLVYKNFNPTIHIIQPFKVTKQDFVVMEALDPHPRTPDAVLWLATDKNGTRFVVNELYVKAKTASLAEQIKTKSHPYRIIGRIADPSLFVEDKHQADPKQASLANALFNDYDLDYQPATKDRVAADRRIGDALDYELKGNELILPPELYIFSTCTRTIWEIQHYQWDEWRGVTKERKDPRQKPMDKDDHMIECLGRLLLQDFRWTPHIDNNSEMGYYGGRVKELDPFN